MVPPAPGIATRRSPGAYGRTHSSVRHPSSRSVLEPVSPVDASHLSPYQARKANEVDEHGDSCNLVVAPLGDDPRTNEHSLNGIALTRNNLELLCGAHEPIMAKKVAVLVAPTVQLGTLGSSASAWGALSRFSRHQPRASRISSRARPSTTSLRRIPTDSAHR